MGTNYYARYRRCQHCARYNEIHLGKSSFGWSFSFHGQRPSKWELVEGVDEILSEAHWRAWMRDNSHQIYDEYGAKVLDREFWEIVEAKRGAKYNHTLDCQLEHPSYAQANCWLDPDTGSSFAEGEFS